MPGERVLVCGAGIAGSILAFWLAKYDFQVVVIERSKANQKTGQGLEIEEPALTVVREMGVLEQLEEKRTAETGFELVDPRWRSWGRLAVDETDFSPTGRLELMRGDLTEVFYKAADASPNVTYRFETTIQSLRQTHDKVVVDMEHRPTRKITSEEFDLVVGADGARSRTRELILGPAEKINCYKPVGAYNAYFAIPRVDQDWPYARLCHFEGRKVVWTRPAGKDSNTTSVYLIHINDNVPNLREANASGDRAKQKAAVAELFGGLGWETPRILDEMMKADNFYSDELVQVKLPKWSQDRVVLLGDSAWAPTPFTGEGNQLAIIGAWTLAQELSRNRNPTAFEMYEKRLRSYVENAQKIPLRGYAPYMCCPQSAWGIWLFRTIFYSFVWISKHKFWSKSSTTDPKDDHHDPFDLEIEKEKP